jgi:hypothetical protein
MLTPSVLTLPQFRDTFRHIGRKAFRAAAACLVATRALPPHVNGTARFDSARGRPRVAAWRQETCEPHSTVCAIGQHRCCRRLHKLFLPGAWMSVSCECLCCQVEVSASGWSLVQRSPTECCVSACDQVQRHPPHLQWVGANTSRLQNLKNFEGHLYWCLCAVVWDLWRVVLSVMLRHCVSLFSLCEFLD